MQTRMLHGCASGFASVLSTIVLLLEHGTARLAQRRSLVASLSEMQGGVHGPMWSARGGTRRVCKLR